MTDRKIFSNYINAFAEDRTASSFARVTLKHADADAVMDLIGQPVISDSAGAFIFYENTSDISAVTASTLPDASPIGIIVGNAYGAGSHDATTVTAAGIEVTVMFRDGTAIFDNIDWVCAPAVGVTAALTTKQTQFTVQLEKQRIVDLKKSVAADPKFV